MRKKKSKSKKRAPKPPPTRREIWNADFLIETSVFGCAADVRENYERLAKQLRRMTAREEYGKAWVPFTTLEEIAATRDRYRRSALCRVS